MNRKNFLVVSALIALLALVMGTFEPFKLCGDMWRECMAWNYKIGILIQQFIPVFIFALVTLRMPEVTYTAWFRFTLFWFPLSILAILFSPEYSADFLYGIDQGGAAFITSAAYVLVSIVIIGYTYFFRRTP